jgi:hypothetical protein
VSSHFLSSSYMLLFCRLNCGNKSRGGSYISRERGRVEGNTDGKGRVARD